MRDIAWDLETVGLSFSPDGVMFFVAKASRAVPNN